jgi:hypothetical protein
MKIFLFSLFFSLSFSATHTAQTFEEEIDCFLQENAPQLLEGWKPHLSLELETLENRSKNEKMLTKALVDYFFYNVSLLSIGQAELLGRRCCTHVVFFLNTCAEEQKDERLVNSVSLHDPHRINYYVGPPPPPLAPLFTSSDDQQVPQ